MATKSTEKYIEAVGRRKTSIARVRISEAKSQSVIINGKELSDFFKTDEQRAIVLEAIEKNTIPSKFAISIKILGGGMHSQAEAIRLGIARCLITFDKELRAALKEQGFLKRDPRAKERRKFGLKKARKSPQWSKR